MKPIYLRVTDLKFMYSIHTEAKQTETLTSEQRKVYCMAMRGKRGVYTPQIPHSPKGFIKAFLKAG